MNDEKKRLSESLAIKGGFVCVCVTAEVIARQSNSLSGIITPKAASLSESASSFSAN